jgi:DNA-binding transcriptional regulator LsrR (DeoR family)
VKQREIELILKAARLYYEENLSQDQVATQLNTSRSNVSRMLTTARSQGFVEIKIVAPLSRHETVAAQLKKLLGIKEIQVVSPSSNELALNAVGRAAASALITELKPNQTIAISWGRGLEATVLHCKKDTIPGLKVTQLMGALSNVETSVTADDIGRTLARNLNATFVPFNAPVVVSNQKIRNSLLEESQISQVLDLARHANIALVGIGSHASSSSEMVLDEFHLPEKERSLVGAEYAGDIAARFYNNAGKIINAVMDSRVIGLSLEEIRKIPRVIGVANGTEKVLGVIGAARAKLVDALVIDLACANSILKFLATTEAVSA